MRALTAPHIEALLLAAPAQGPLAERHLSTGQIAAAMGTLGMAALHEPAFWWCVAAIPLTGLCNVGVSFVLALRVAARSRGVRVKDRQRLASAIVRRLIEQPGSFFLPPKSPVAQSLDAPSSRDEG